MNAIIVKYWRGTTQLQGKARTYAGAMRIAARNQNAYPATFWTPEGVELLNDGNGLVEESEADRWGRNPKSAMSYYA